MKPIVALSILSLLVALVTGCGSDSGSGDGGVSGGDRTPSREFLSIGTAPPGGAFFVVGGAIGEVLNENRGDEGWQVTAEATKGSQENIRRLARGELDLALSNSAISYFAVRGEAGWDQAYPIRTVMTLAPNVAMFITPASSRIRSIADLRGKRVVLGPAGAGFEFFIRPLLEAHGVAWDELSELHATQAGAVDMLADGSAAAAFLGGAVPTASITQASSSRDIFFVPFTAEAMQQVTSEYVFFRPATIPSGTYRGQDEDFHGLDVGSMHLIAAEGADEDLIYRLTRTIYENREKVVAKHAAGRAINPKNVVRDTGTEFHPGAVRYYREIGIWPEAEATN
jgi:TRAP transporter TAXI family solute receptor